MEKLVTYLDLQTNTIRKILLQPGDKLTPGTFHKLRVSIKKLRSLLKLAGYFRKNFSDPKYLEATDTIFNQAGKVRELQIERDYLKETATNKLSDFTASLEQSLELEQDKFIQLKQAFRKLIPKEPTQLKSAVHHLSRQDIDCFLEQKSKRLFDRVKSKKLGNRRAHALRKELKTLQYLQKCTGFNKRKSPLLSKATQLSEILGNWHDQRVLSKQFKAALNSAGLEQTSRAALLEVRSNIKDQTKVQFKRIKKAINKL